MTMPAAPPPEWIDKLARAEHHEVVGGVPVWEEDAPGVREAFIDSARAGLTAIWPDVLAAAAAHEQQLRQTIANEIRAFLHEVSDMLDPVEGPVIIAWSTDVLADRITERIAAGSPATQEQS